MLKYIVLYLMVAFNPIVDAKIEPEQIQLHPTLGVILSVHHKGVVFEYSYPVLETNYTLECSFLLTRFMNTIMICEQGVETVVRYEPLLYRQRDSLGNWTEWEMWIPNDGGKDE